MIIDAHAHLGPCRVFDHDVTAGDLLRTMDQNGIDASVVFPLPGAQDARLVHDQIAEVARDNPGRIFGVACPNPHVDDAVYRDEVARCVHDLGFVAIKLHTLGHACSPTCRDAAKVFDTARDLAVPLIVHTGIGVPFALPSMVIPRALQYPDVKIVLAHAGAYIYTGEAQVAASVCPNIHLETSWCSPRRIFDLASTFPGRVLFGGDLPYNVPSELAKYHTCGLDEDALAIALGRAAQAVFDICYNDSE